MKTIAKHDPTFPQYVAIWRKYLQGWLNWDNERFNEFVNDRGSVPSGVIFHEDAFYYVLPLLADRELIEPPIDFYGNKSWASFGWTQLYSAIYRDGGQFDDYTATDEEWDAAKQRAEKLLVSIGTRLAVK